jgi:hypothetical protein
VNIERDANGAAQGLAQISELKRHQQYAHGSGTTLRKCPRSLPVIGTLSMLNKILFSYAEKM